STPCRAWGSSRCSSMTTWWWGPDADRDADRDDAAPVGDHREPRPGRPAGAPGGRLPVRPVRPDHHRATARTGADPAAVAVPPLPDRRRMHHRTRRIRRADRCARGLEGSAAQVPLGSLARASHRRRARSPSRQAPEPAALRQAPQQPHPQDTSPKQLVELIDGSASERFLCFSMHAVFGTGPEVVPIPLGRLASRPEPRPPSSGPWPPPLSLTFAPSMPRHSEAGQATTRATAYEAWSHTIHWRVQLG